MLSRTVLDPCIDALREQGNPFVGCLYAGLMLTPDGVRVLEFNARFGDPETQVVLPLLDESLLDVIAACARGEVGAGIAPLRLGLRSALSRQRRVTRGTCVAATSSPASTRSMSDVLCFHAGTVRDAEGTLRTAGGRVLCITAVAADV